MPNPAQQSKAPEEQKWTVYAFETVPAEDYASLRERLASLEGSYADMKRARTAALRERDQARERLAESTEQVEVAEERVEYRVVKDARIVRSKKEAHARRKARTDVPDQSPQSP